MHTRRHGKSKGFILPQPSNYSTKIKATGQADNNEKDTAIGSFLFIGLTLFFCIELTFILVKNRPFHLFWIACILCSILTGYFVKKIPANNANKTRQRAFIFIMAVSALFLANRHVPISSASISIRPISETTEFILRQFLSNHADTFRKIYKAPSQQTQTIHFRLPNVIQKQSKLLRLYFGRHPDSYDIMKISFGTLVLWQPIALTSYTGNNILKIAGTEKTLNHFDLINNSVVHLASINRSRPILNISTDEAKIRKDMTSERVYAVKLLWFFLYTGSSWLIIWGPTLRWLKIPGISALRGYLTQ